MKLITLTSAALLAASTAFAGSVSTYVPVEPMAPAPVAVAPTQYLAPAQPVVANPGSGSGSILVPLVVIGLIAYAINRARDNDE